MTLKDLKRVVDRQAELFQPDFKYSVDQIDELQFEEVPLHKVLGDLTAPEVVGLVFKRPDDANVHYLTTDWSRHQLLQALGAREKWFDPVPISTQVEELSRRRHVLDSMVFKTMKGDPAYPLRTLRGLVSSSYTDIPNVDIMEALVNTLPEDTSYALRRFSGLTDQAFYTYLLLDHPISLPGSTEGYPGVVIKNSEVGFTSLWVIPFLFIADTGRAAVMEPLHLFRRIHRGKVNDLQEKFEEAIGKMKPLWESLSAKIQTLDQITFANADEAMNEMERIILHVKGAKLFALRCRQAYQKAGYTAHTAYNIFECICDTAGKDLDPDVSYSKNAVAGAVLLKLVL